MALPYRTRRSLKRLGKFILILLLICAIGAGCWIAWAGRFVVYSREGARLDFSRPAQELSGVLAVPPETKAPVPLYYNEGENAVAISGDLSQFAGYYLTAQHFKGDIEELRKTLLALPDTVPIMMELKDIYGEFYYNTGMAGAKKNSVANSVHNMVADLIKSHRYIIAMIPAFRDYEFGLNNVNCGVPHSSGGYLWMDGNGCYWLDPDKGTTLNYLTGIISELKTLGVSEVVLRDFRIPTEGNILYEEDVDTVIAEAKEFVVKNCANADTFAVSFLAEDPAFTLPEGARCRLYLEGVSALQVKTVAEETSVENKQTQLVFMTALTDTRFEEYCVVRPVDVLQ